MINEHDYPISPEYYRDEHGNDCRTMVDPGYWMGHVITHLFRRGRKPGETSIEAVSSAFIGLAMWFWSQGLRVPFYSDALDRLRAENARLRAELAERVKDEPSPPGRVVYVNEPEFDAMPQTCDNVQPPVPADLVRLTGIDGPWVYGETGPIPGPVGDRWTCGDYIASYASGHASQWVFTGPSFHGTGATITDALRGFRPASPTLDTPATSADEWTDDELRAWLDANRCPRRTTPHGVYIWDFQPSEYAYGMTLGDNGWHGLAIDHLGHPDGKSATEAARILNATKPADPFAELLTIETDGELREWLSMRYTPCASMYGWVEWMEDPQVAFAVGETERAGADPWIVVHRTADRLCDRGSRRLTARDAARALHRILTGGAA